MRWIDIDLSAGRVTRKRVDDKVWEQFMGGSGLGAFIAYREKLWEHNPLSPGNVLIFAAGPFTGTKIPCSGRHALVSRSPLTGMFAESDVGGRWGTALVKCGIHLITVRGMSEHPVYAEVSPGGCRIHGAEEIWGLDTFEVSDRLQQMHGKKTVVSCIGPAGENRVHLASVMHDGSDARAAGRCGLGAVMGSKNLKALAVVPTGGKAPRQSEELGQIIPALTRKVIDAGKGLRSCGTAGGFVQLEKSGDLPVKNFTEGGFRAADRLDGSRVSEKYLKKKYSCGACPVGCGRVVEMRAPRFGEVRGAGPEYESTASLGSYCMVDDLEAVVKANDLCNRYGMDTISVGSAISFAMEAFEKGILTSEDFGGEPLFWGDAEKMIQMVEAIGKADGIGRLLGKGVRHAAGKLGRGSDRFAIHVKGLELPAHDPRAYFSSAVSYATSSRGACHLAGMTHVIEDAVTVPEIGISETLPRFANEGKGWAVARMQDLMGVYDSLKICKFVTGTVTVSELAECHTAVTGRKTTVDSLMKAGERIFNIKRLFNLKCGMSGEQDTLPGRILSEPRPEGSAAGKLPDLSRMLKDYYEAREWDENGIPLESTVERLELDRI
ncbi:MAG: aldehyde ferredoxin oxidoreductase family protein [Desulfarculaceae bacterium]|nr:aldehyde ferredoxin oxidoreductase family protein [Desulfarculaceae bacterium]